MCGHDLSTMLQTDYHTLLCTQCGFETAHFGSVRPINQSYTQSVYPFSQCYSRKKRFREMIENIFFPCFTTLDNILCEKLSNKIINSVQDLFKIVKHIGVKDKRYGSMHVFAHQFCKEYISPTPVATHVVNNMCQVFSEIELVYTRLFGNVQFFNYSWLIIKFLNVLKLNKYCCYIKPLKCKKRVHVYENKFNLVMRELVRLNIGLKLVDDLVNFQLQLSQ